MEFFPLNKFQIIGILLLVMVPRYQSLTVKKNFVCKGNPADIVFILDSSSSIYGEDFQRQLDFVKYMVDHLDIGYGPKQVQIGVETFSDKATIQIRLDNFLDKTVLKTKIDNIPHTLGNTSIDDALRVARTSLFDPNYGARPYVRRVAILLTDGSAQDEDATQREARACRNANIDLFVIGIGHYINRAELEGIASKPSSTYLFYTPTYKALDKIRDNVIKKTCEDINKAKPNLVCKGKPADIVFMLDSSRSISREHFKKQLDFVNYMVDRLDVGHGPKQVQIGVETFSDATMVHINLNNHLGKAGLKSEISRIPQIVGNTSTADALKVMRNSMFNPQNGARANVRRVGIILTDGVSQDEPETLREAKESRDENIELFVIGIGHHINPAELEGIANKPSSDYFFHTPSYGSLNTIKEELVQSDCKNYKEVPVEPELMCKDKPADIVFVLDASKGLTGEYFKNQLDFVKDTIDHLDIGNQPQQVRIGVETYSGPYTTVQINLNNFLDKPDLKSSIDQITQVIGSSVNDNALKVLRTTMFQPFNGARPNVKHKAIILTDGLLDDEYVFEKEAMAAHKGNIELYVVRIGHSTPVTNLKEIASKPSSNYIFHVPNSQSLNQVRDDVINNTCNDVEPEKIKPFIPKEPELLCNDKAADVVFVLDSSISIWGEHFQKQLHFVQSMVDYFDVGYGPKQVQVGVETFSDSAKVHINLNNYLGKAGLKSEISKIPQILGNTSTADALKMMRKSMFNPQNGARANVRRVGIILTDGASQDEQATLREAQKCRDENIELFVIGIGHHINPSELEGIANKPISNYFFHTPSYDSLNKVKEKLIEDECKDKKEVPVEPELMCKDKPADIVFVLDASKGLTGEYFKNQLDFVKDTIDHLDIGNRPNQVRIGVETFSGPYTTVQINLNNFLDKPDLKSSIDQITQVIGSSVNDNALKVLRTIMFQPYNGARLNVKHKAIILTDGSFYSKQAIEKEAMAAHKGNIELYVVRIGHSTPVTNLKEIASKPSSNYFFHVPNPQSLDHVREDVINNTCNDVEPVPVEPELMCKDKPADIVFVLDASKGLTGEYFKNQLDFVKDTIDHLDIGNRPNQIRIGVETYSGPYTTVQINLNNFLDKPDLKSSIDQITQVSGSSVNDNALKVLRTIMFQPYNGARPNVKHKAIILTDGLLDDEHVFEKEAMAAHKGNIELYVVRIGHSTPVTNLKEIASKPSSNYFFHVPNSQSLDHVRDDVINNTCNDVEPEKIKPFIPKEPELLCNDKAADVVFLLDSSTSIRGEHLQKQLHFVQSMVDYFDVGYGPKQVQVGVETFSDSAKVHINLNNYLGKAGLKSEISKIPQILGNTSTADALKMMRNFMFNPQNGARANVRRVGIILTDGASQDEQATLREAQKCRDENIELFVIGIGHHINPSELEGIANKPISNYFFHTPSYDSLNKVKEKLIEDECKDKNEGEPDFVCQGKPADIVFVLDSSKSIWGEHFMKQLDFVKNMVDRFDVGQGPKQVQIGVEAFSDAAKFEIKLNNHLEKSDLKKKIDKIPRIRGDTNTADALRMMCTSMFNPQNGARANVRRIGIILIEGATQEEQAALREAQTCRDENIELFVIGIGHHINYNALEQIANKPSSDYFFHTPTYGSLNEIQDQLMRNNCKDHSKVKPEPEPDLMCKDKPADIVFMLDVSKGLTVEYFKNQLDFVKYSVDHLDIGNQPEQVRIGVVTSDGPYTTIPINLNNFLDKSDLKSRIDQITQIIVSSVDDNALKVLRTTMFQPYNGARLNVKHKAIILTDGSFYSKQAIEKEAMAAHKGNIELYVVRIGHSTPVTNLKEIASKPSSNYFFRVPNAQSLYLIRDDVINNTCNDIEPEKIKPFIPKEPELLCNDKAADVVFVLDSSISIWGEHFQKQLHFVQSMVDYFDVGYGPKQVQVGVETFSDSAKVHINLNNYLGKAGLKSEISKIPQILGNTSTADALKMMRKSMFNPQNGARANVRRVGIILTDGASQDEQATLREAQKCRDENIELFVIGIGHHINPSELEGIANKPISNYFFHTPSYDSLNKIKEKLIEDKCKDKKEVPVEPELMCKDKPADIVFVLDASKGLTGEYFKNQLDFVKDTIDHLDIGNRPEQVRIGVETFNGPYTTVQINLNNFLDKPDLKSSIDQITQVSGSSVNDNALKVLRTIMFQPYNGARPNVKHKAIILTDGLLDDEYVFEKEAMAAHKGNIELYVVRIGHSTPVTNLKEIASKPSSNYFFHVPNSQSLDHVRDDVINNTCNDIEPVPVEPELMCKDKPADIVFVLDASKGLTGEYFKNQLDFVKDTIDHLDIGNRPEQVRIGVETFSGPYTTVQINLNNFLDKPDLKSSIDQITQVSGSSVNDNALKVLRTTMFQPYNGARLNVKHKAIILTDGLLDDEYVFEKEAMAAHKGNIELYVVRIGHSTPVTNLKEIASKPSSNYFFHVPNSQSLNQVRDDVINNTCNEIEQGKPAMLCKGKPTDLVFVIDSSSRIWRESYEKQIDFVKSVVDRLDIGDGKTQVRIGVATFTGSSTTVQINLNNFFDKPELKSKIDLITKRAGSSMDKDVLEVLRTIMFQPYNGARPNAKHKAVILTDGSSLDKNAIVEEARKTQDANIELYVVGIGHHNDPEKLKDIASRPSSNYFFFLRNYESLDNIPENVTENTCNDIEPEKITFACKDQPADIVFMLDSSKSIWAEHFKKQLDFVKYMVDNLDVGNGPKQVQIGVETFSDTATVQIPLDNSLPKHVLTSKIEHIPQILGNTSIESALKLLRTIMFAKPNGARPNVRRIGIMLTDGSSQDELATQREAGLSRDANIELFVIGIGHYVDRVELKGIASKPSTNYLFYTPSYDALDKIKGDLLNNTCRHAIKVKPELVCTGKPSDIVFVIDSSSTLWRENFQKHLDFVNYIIDRLDIGDGPKQVRIGVETFSDLARVYIKLDDFLEKPVLKWKIHQIPQRHGNASIGDALWVLRNTIFTPSEGSRPNVRHVAIFLTDGSVNDAHATHMEALASRDANIELFVIGIGKNIIHQKLKGIASKPDSTYFFHATKHEDLNRIRDEVINNMCENVKNKAGPTPPVDPGSGDAGCESASRTEVVFMISSHRFGKEKTHLILEATNDIIKSFASHNQFHFGLIFDDNVENQDVTIGPIKAQSPLKKELAKYQFPSFVTLMKKLRSIAFPSQPFKARRIGFVFLDKTIDIDSPEILAEARNARFQSIEIFAVIIGDVDQEKVKKILTDRDHIIRIPSYQRLMSFPSIFTEHLCTP